MSDPAQRIRTHGILGIVWGCLFCISIITTVANLSRLNHNVKISRSRHRLPLRYHGRRKYYIVLLTAVIGAATSFLAIDVDRDAAPALNFKLQCVFYTILHPFLLLSTFETVRYWIWCLTRDRELERDAHYLASGLGSTFTILFYVLDGAALLLCVARDWDDLLKQRPAVDAEQGAKNAVMDGRSRSGQFLMLLCLVNITVRLLQGWLQHSKLKHGANHASFARLILVSTATLLSGLSVGYNLTSSYTWRISPYNLAVSQSYYYGYGINPVWMNLIIINTTSLIGYGNDLATQQHRRKGSLRKPDWWNNSKADVSGDNTSLLDLHHIKDVRGREERYESRSSWWWQKTEDGLAQLHNSGNHEQESEWLQLDGVPRNSDKLDEPNQGGAIGSSFPSSSRQRPQQRPGMPVKSMLEI